MTPLAGEALTPEVDAIVLRLTGETGLFCDDKSLSQYNDLVRCARSLEARLREAERALRFYVAICGNTGHTITRESAKQAYDMAEAALTAKDPRNG